MAVQKVWDEELQDYVYDDPELDEAEVNKRIQDHIIKDGELPSTPKNVRKISLSYHWLRSLLNGDKSDENI